MRYLKAFFDGATSMGIALAILVYYDPIRMALAVFTAAIFS